MDFSDQIMQFSKRVEQLMPSLQTEEATKMSLIVPFFQLLGYDVFNPAEFMPEYIADVGIKKGEKVDYAILDEGSPVILIEAKWCGESLEKHDSQLFRYFGVTSARFGILTNGVVYKFYTDLDEKNKMDLTPFLEVDLLNLRPNDILELKKFHKDNFNIEDTFSAASELKYSKQIKKFMQTQLDSPSDDFVKYVLSEIYAGVKTQNVIDRFRPIIKKALNAFVSELMNDKISAALKTETSAEETKKEEIAEEAVEEPASKIHTTEQEIEAFYIIKSILAEFISPDEISYKDTETYFGVLLDNNIRKWVCRLKLDGRKKFIIIPDENKKEVRYDLSTSNDLYSLRKELLESAKRYSNTL